MNSTVSLEIDDGVVTFVWNRPESGNAVDVGRRTAVLRVGHGSALLGPPQVRAALAGIVGSKGVCCDGLVSQPLTDAGKDVRSQARKVVE